MVCLIICRPVIILPVTMSMIINELLLYAKHYIHSSSTNNVKKMIQHFYDDNEIIEAKKKLWGEKKDVLGEYPDRKSTINRSASIPNVNDIFDALKRLDAANEMPKIAGVDLSRIPDRQPEELNLLTMIDRVARIEHSIARYEETLSSLAIDMLELKERPPTFSEVARSTDTDNLRIDERAPALIQQQIDIMQQNTQQADLQQQTEAQQSNIRRPNGERHEAEHHDLQRHDNQQWRSSIQQRRSAIQQRRSAIQQHPVIPEPARDSGGRPNYTRPNPTHGRGRRGVYGGRDFSRARGRPPARGNPPQRRAGPGSRPPPVAAAASDDEGWTKVDSSRRRGRRRVVGCGDVSDEGLEGAPPPLRQVWVSRVASGDEQTIKQFLERKNVVVNDIGRVSHVDAKYKSYKISVNVNDLDTVLEGSFWPRGLLCQVWRESHRDPGRRNSRGHDLGRHTDDHNIINDSDNNVDIDRTVEINGDNDNS